MNQLIEITSVPIEIEMKTSHARLEYANASADLEISRDKGGLSIKSRPIRLNIDTFEMQSSITPTAAQKIEQNAQKGKQAAYEATATFVQQGQMMMKTKLGEDVMQQIAEQAMMKHTKLEVGMEFLPKTGPEITWDPGEMNIKYEMEKLNIDWKINEGDFEFTPADIEFTMTQRPEVVIKYVGGPVYVPPSADPNYEGADAEG